MTKKLLSRAILFSVLCTGIVNAQSPEKIAGGCGTEVPSQQWEAEFQNLIKELRAGNAVGKSQAVLYTIPVIIHVIHGGQQVGAYPNLAQGQLKSQIQVLNNDFGGVGFNSQNYPSSAFVSWAASQAGINPASLDGSGRIKIANCNIQFCLATKDTMGNTLAEPGIERINYVSKGWSNPGSFGSLSGFKNFMDGTVKPGTIWNVTKYFNIWVTDINIFSTGLLGYATFPPLTSGLGGLTQSNGTATTDGIWCYAMAFGSQNIFPGGSYYSNNKYGRTATHEVGHWVGLRHIWGDGNCATPGVTDYCDDTPPASGQNFNSPTYPHKTSNCVGNFPNGEMFMNFMDYPDDAFKYMYTEDQSTRVQTAMATSPHRKFLGTHNLCTIAAMAPTSQFNVPASTCGTITAVTLTNMATGIPVPNYAWSSSGGVTFSPNINSAAVSASFANPGTYTITLTTNNGTMSSTSRTITINPFPDLVFSAPNLTVCYGQEIIINATGGNTYTWLPDGNTGPTLIYPGQFEDQTFTCVATGDGSCTTIGSITIRMSDCVGLNKIGRSVNAFDVYPNPAGEKIIIKGSGDVDVVISLSDALGRTVIRQAASLRKEKNEAQVNTSQLPGGVYILMLSASDGRKQTLKLIKQ